MPTPVFCLMGPTASGKTALAIELVQRFPMEIVSVDSVMIYRGMDIGSAKPDAATLAKAPHHLVDIRDPHEPYSAAGFCADARRVIDEILARGRIPLLVGGTMLYFRALQQGLSDLPSANADIRFTLMERAKNESWPSLHADLARVDPDRAKRVHPHDAQRIQRALEVFLLTGQPMSELQEKREATSLSFRVCNLAVSPEAREILHQRIADRFVEMLASGLIEETQSLLSDPRVTPELPALRSAGYRQVCEFLAGRLTHSALSEKGIIATRQLAKRQLTWLRHWPEVRWFASDRPHLLQSVTDVIADILSAC